MSKIAFPVIFGCFLALLSSSWCIAKVTPVPLEASDCVKCHKKIVQQVNKEGASHKTEVTCLDCHLEHPPVGQKTIPECTMCHDPDDSSHFATTVECTSCHKPHTPLTIEFSRSANLREACNSCHSDKGAEFRAYPSDHANLDCRQCHPKHAEHLDCDQCHDPAQKGHYAIQNCMGCHKPHSPLNMAFAEIKNVKPACISCHQTAAKELETHPSAHTELDCNACHLVHGEFLECMNCHTPHSRSMTYQDCLLCHKPHEPAEILWDRQTPASLCQKCHPQPVQDISVSGGAHKTSVTCIDCHGKHPPQEGSIPDCGLCHEPTEKDHYAIGNCEKCHPAHSPMDMDLAQARDVKQACNSCHSKQGQQMASFTSLHTRFDCNVCHPVHGEHLECAQCHRPHTEGMTYQDCISCHEPHLAAEITYAQEVRANLCAGCHEEVVAKISSRGAAHKTEVTCLDCHSGHPGTGCMRCHSEHPEKGETIPKCFACHELTQRAHFTLEGCNSCHPPHSPLDLNLEAGDTKQACLTCHPAQGQETRRHPSAHAGLDCSECHQTHGEFFECLECHDPHTPDMDYEACLSCHKPHSPTLVNFEKSPPSSFCSGCHPEASRDIDASGEKHKTELECADCHQNHPPQTEKIIPVCADCHDPGEKKHYGVPKCDGCHPPHSPLEIDLSTVENVRPACVSCHLRQNGEFIQHPSSHAELDCKACHMAHGEFHECLKCHVPHSEEMTHGDCTRCHRPHSPTVVEYGAGIPSSFCSCCHGKEAEQMAQTSKKHRDLECVACHENRHKAIYQCNICHGQPHGSDLHGKYPDCLKCHADPHNLADW